MKISIIIPTLNEAKNIGHLVNYLHQHSGDAISEVIVVDGGSTDATADLAEKAGAMVISIQEASRARQMNTGAAKATAEVLYFVHADTMPPSTFATDILTELRAGYQMGCYRYQFNSTRLILRFNAWFVRFPWLWCQGGDKTFFITRQLFEAMGGYDEKYVVMEEYDFLRRVGKKHPLRIMPKNAIVSARKYEKNSWLRVQIANATAFMLFRLGQNPTQIRTIYKQLLH